MSNTASKPGKDTSTARARRAKRSLPAPVAPVAPEEPTSSADGTGTPLLKRLPPSSGSSGAKKG